MPTFLHRAGNALDHALSLVAPRSASRRIAARNALHAFSYDGAQDTRYRNRIWTDHAPEGGTISAQRVQLIREARDLEKNFPPVARLLQFAKDYAYGELRYKARTGDAAMDASYNDYFSDWSQVCDVTGRDSLRTLCQLWLGGGCLRDADCGVIFADVDGELRLQTIEGDCIGGNLLANATDKNPRYINGITIDALGRPVSFLVFERTITGAYENPKEIPAASFVHIARRKRAAEYRPVSAFAPVITTCRDVKEIVDAMRVGVKWEAFQSAFITRTGGLATPGEFVVGAENDPNSAGKQRLKRMEPGMIHYGEPGEGVVTFKSDRPAMPWQQFISHLINMTALGVNFPPGVVFWLSGMGSADVRGQLVQVFRTIQSWQAHIEECALNRIKNVALAHGIAAGRIPYHTNFMRGKWRYAAAATIDAGRQSAADINENAAALRSASAIFAENGEDFEDEVEMLAYEESFRRQMAEKYGVPADSIRLPRPGSQPALTAPDTGDPADGTAPGKPSPTVDE